MTTQSEQSLEYIRQYYNVPAHKGQRVRFLKDNATIVGGSNQYLILHFDGAEEPDNGRFHPTWEIEYLEEENQAKA